MKIEVILTEDAFKRFTIFDVLRRRKAWRPPVTFAVIMGISAAICFAMRHVDGAVLLGNVLLTIGLGMPIVYFTSFYFSLRKQVLASGLVRPQHVYTITLTHKFNGIHAENEKEQADYEWQKVHHCYRTETATYLFITPERAFLLPHTCLEEGVEELWKLLKKKLSPKQYTILR